MAFEKMAGEGIVTRADLGTFDDEEIMKKYFYCLNTEL